MGHIFSNIVEIERQMFNHDNDAENNKRHEDGIGENIEHIIKKLKGTGVILKMYGRSF